MIPQLTTTQRLRVARETSGYDRDAEGFAPVVGLSRQTISNYERGATTPDRRSLMAWSAATGVPVWWLEGHDREPVGGSPVINCFIGKSDGIVVDLESKRRIVGQKAQRPAA